MMPPILRIQLALAALVFVAIVFGAVNKRILQMRQSLIWLAISFLAALAAAFPGIITWLIGFLGIETPVNFVFFVGIFVLAIICFSLTITVSKQQEAIKRLTQVISIEKALREEAEGRQNDKESL
jgi:hypothetical protein